MPLTNCQVLDGRFGHIDSNVNKACRPIITTPFHLSMTEPRSAHTQCNMTRYCTHMLQPGVCVLGASYYWYNTLVSCLWHDASGIPSNLYQQPGLEFAAQHTGARQYDDKKKSCRLLPDLQRWYCNMARTVQLGDLQSAVFTADPRLN
jgi:hypothetical protein